MKTLLVDDERTSRIILARSLEKLGHEVLQAEQGAQALGMVDRASVEVLLSDWMMPEMDGPALCRAIRAKPRDRYVYIVLVTSIGRENLVEGLDAGADDFINKPIDHAELGARLRVAQRILGLQAKMKQLRGMLSICSYCDKIREGESWVPVESYVEQRSEAYFSHGVCPTCYGRHFGPNSEFERTGNWPSKGG